MAYESGPLLPSNAWNGEVAPQAQQQPWKALLALAVLGAASLTLGLSLQHPAASSQSLASSLLTRPAALSRQPVTTQAPAVRTYGAAYARQAPASAALPAAIRPAPAAFHMDGTSMRGADASSGTSLLYVPILGMVVAGLVCLGRRLMAQTQPVQAPMMAMAATTGELEEVVESGTDYEFESAFLKVMKERGFLHQCTDGEALDKKMQKEVVVAYLGFDATADSLHVGSLLQIMILRHLQQSGHKPIVLVGGGTSKVGDPSGKDASRQMMTNETIQQNMDGLSKVFYKFLKFGDGPTDAVMVNNDDWLGSLKYLEFLRDYGPLFTINRMLTFESVKQRLERESPLTFLEFNYMLLQAYDFVELYRRYGVSVQMGGSDQWGNIINGVELGRRVEEAQLFGVTAPLITTSDGKKMGKSASGAVWLNEDKLSPFDYWQFWRNTTDEDVVRFLKLFTELPLDRIEELGALKGAAINEAKKVLADECTRMLHGEECLADINSAAQALFAGGKAATQAMNKVQVDGAKISAGLPITDLYVEAGLANTKSEARRLIQGGGARLNDVQIKDVKMMVTAETFPGGEPVKLSSGKKKHVLIEPQGEIAMLVATGEKVAASEVATSEDKFYITTPIYYVNDVPHIGHAYTTVACDVLARFARLDGATNVNFLTGTDEHGQKVQASAGKFEMAPQEYVDMRSQRFRELATAVGATNTDFIRTTEGRHQRAVTKLWNTLREKGDIYLGKYEGWYSVRDEAFYAESEIVDGKAPTGAEVEWVVEPSYFFKLSAWQDKLLEWYEANPDAIAPSSRRNEVLSFVKGGLQDLSVSRTSFDWGVPVPGEPGHVMYVWVDALTNYLTAAGYAQGEELEDGTYADAPGFAEQWPASLHVVGKDILRFHAVYWPCMLMAAGLPLPKRVFAHGWWTKDGEKISKSLGNVIDPFDLLERYGLDATRYFLTAEVQFGADGDYSDERFAVRVNTQLCNGLGNLCNRILNIAYKNCGQATPTLPEGSSYTEEDQELLDLAHGLLGRVRTHFHAQALAKAADEIFTVCSAANKYVEEQAPWGLKKTDPDRMQVVLYVTCEVIRHLAITLTPYTPDLSSKILDSLGVPADAESRGFAALAAGPLTQGTPIPKPAPLVPRIEAE